MNLGDSIISIKGVGDKTATLLNKMQLYTVEDVLHYYPRDYITYRPPVLFSDVVSSEQQAICGKLVGKGLSAKRVRNLTILSGSVIDCNDNVKNIISGCERENIQITFFNMPYLKKTMLPNKPYVFYGVIQRKNNQLVMEQPKVYRIDEYQQLLGKMQPVYTITKGITSHFIGKMIHQILSQMNDEFKEYLPKEIVLQEKLMSFSDAIYHIHFPKVQEELIQARNRLAFDEFFLFILSIRKMKEKNLALPFEHPLQYKEEVNSFINCLPFQLTNAQMQVWKEMEIDLLSNQSMNRLIQGDVGSGKTILAFLGLLLVAANGRQGALMAPTEVLAKQHYDTLMELTLTHNLCFTPVLLVGSMTAKEKRIAYEKIASGEANVIVGTHALIQEKVIYKELALVITDEQHRFGVRQREKLSSKGEQVHILVMSATPIPRTLAIILYGDLHISVLNEMPVGRLPIKNCVVNTNYRKKAYEFIEKEVANGRQAYVICPMVEEGETDNIENVIDYAVKLQSQLPSTVRIAPLHGKMKPIQKNNIMDAYARREIDVLVSTTVIEVGINVPNASVMMIENAERFGLAQLHQLRGRVGRGKEQSYCIFVSSSESKKTMERLDVLNQSNDGFFIANRDLKSRGPGDMFGIKQSGILAFKIGDVYQDSALLIHVSQIIDAILEEDTELILEKNKGISELFTHHFTKNIDFRTL